MDKLALTSWIRPGDRIVCGQGGGEPQTLVEALMAQGPGIGPLSVLIGASFSGLFQPDPGERIRFSSWGAVGQLRNLTDAGRLDLIPCNLSQVSAYIRQGDIACDVALVQVSRPDAAGRHSYSASNDYLHAAVAKARTVIAEVNAQAPFTTGDAWLPAERIDLRVDSDRPLVQVRSAAPTPVDVAIAQAAAEFVGDGATLQMGVGATPDALLRSLRDRRDLGVHSGMAGDALVDLIEAGAVTNARKPFDRGVSVVSLLIGSDRLYGFSDNNAAIAVQNSSYVMDEGRLAALPDLVSVNSAVEVDLTGQINAEQVGGDYVGGIGGHGDFSRAGHRSPGGRSLVVLPATARKGGLSRIVARLSGPVTTARSDADVIVTEFGSASLRGQPMRERARRLIAIAHPAFREALERDAFELERRGY